jgi:PhnB protein
MAKVSVYLNFKDQTEEAFGFYKQVFGNEFLDKGIVRFRDMPAQEGAPKMSEEDLNLVMHVALPLMGDFVLMGTDAPESMGFKLNQGNNAYINLELDTKGEADRLFNALAEGGVIEMPLQMMFWGDYFGSLRDRFGVNWMINCAGA